MRRRPTASRPSTDFLHHPARSLRRLISLLSTFGAVAGVQLQTSRSIKLRERDLGNLRLFVLVRFFTRPTNHPRHAACASNHESKPVRPLLDQYNPGRGLCKRPVRLGRDPTCELAKTAALLSNRRTIINRQPFRE